MTKLRLDYVRRVVPLSAYETARDALTKQRDEAPSALGRMEKVSDGFGQRAATAAVLLQDWDSLAVVDRNAVLRELAVVWVRYLPDTRRPTIRVLGVWESQPLAAPR